VLKEIRELLSNLNEDEIREFRSKLTKIQEEIGITLNTLYSSIEIEKIDSLIEDFKSLTRNGFEHEQLFKQFEQITTWWSMTIFSIAPEYIFRARIGRHNNYKELWYPPNDRLVHYGRLNRPGQSIFYGCFDPWVALYETKNLHMHEDSQNTFELSVLLLEPNDENVKLKCGLLGFYSDDNGDQIDFSTTNSTTLRSLKVHLDVTAMIYKSIFSEKNYIKFLKINRFARQSLLGNSATESSYKLSSFIAAKIFEHLGVEAIIYPSVANDNGYVNIAVLPKAIDSKFKVAGMDLYRVEEYGPNFVFYPILNSKEIDQDGSIHWHKAVAPKEVMDHLYGHVGLDTPKDI
jgi:hypothetical protein